jgi:hypothetical protein
MAVPLGGGDWFNAMRLDGEDRLLISDDGIHPASPPAML